MRLIQNKWILSGLTILLIVIGQFGRVENAYSGASGWSYFVPYQPDVNKALQELRKQIYRQGGYQKSTLTAEHFRDFLAEYKELYQHPAKEDELKILQQFASLPDGEIPKPKTLEELVIASGADGTHSILDVNGISEIPKFGGKVPRSPQELEALINSKDYEYEFGSLSPLSKDQLIYLFGTEKPNRTLIEKADDKINELIRRWEGIYIVTYKSKSPDELYFVGSSGD